MNQPVFLFKMRARFSLKICISYEAEPVCSFPNLWKKHKATHKQNTVGAASVGASRQPKHCNEELKKTEKSDMLKLEVSEKKRGKRSKCLPHRHTETYLKSKQHGNVPDKGQIHHKWWDNTIGTEIAGKLEESRKPQEENSR